MAAFIAMFIHGAALNRRAGRRLKIDQGDTSRFEKLVPGWAKTTGIAFFVYVIVNFMAFMILHEGRPRAEDGKFTLYYKRTRLIREVSEAEFRNAERFEVRGASGHWMLFSAVPAFYFLYLYPRARVAAASETAAGDGTGRALD